MIGTDGHGDPIPPGHGEPRIHEDGKVYEQAPAVVEPFTGGSAWRPAPLPEEQFGVPLCTRCWYYHHTGEPCTR